MLRIRPLGIALLFLIGVLFLYLGFNGLPRSGANREQPKPGTGVMQVSGQGSNFFVNSRQEREVKRQQQTDILNELINNQNVSAETRKAAQKQLLELNQNAAREAEMENLILAKGFKDAFATITAAGVNLTVYGEKFSPSEITKLQDIAVRIGAVRLENVVIVPRQ